MSLNTIHSFNDLREAARRKLPKGLFDYVDRGSEDEVSLRNNRSAFEAVRLVTRPLVDISGRSLRTTFFGKVYGAPLCIAPTAIAGMLRYQGEVALARAAAHVGIPFALSTASITALETVAQEAAGEHWFQLYLWPKFEMSLELVERARRCGFSTLVVTIDSVVNSNREHNLRNGFTVPMRLNTKNIIDGALHPSWTLGVMGRYLATTGMPRFANFPAEIQTDLRGKSKKGGVPVPKNERQTWEHIRELRAAWPGTLIIKGILHGDDARKALEAGADGIVVSNHGGRTLDGVVAPIQVLPAIAREFRSHMTILLDSSIQRGVDIAKAMALGAHGVMVGRAPLWGIAAAGQRGAEHALGILMSELDRVMAYLGCEHVEELGERNVFTS